MSTHHQPASRPENTATPSPRRFDGLYLHLPFCFHKCHYCDFFSVVDRADQDRQAAFTDALIAELRAWARRTTLRPTTLFVGGGTPTFLRPELWSRLLDALRGLGVLEEVEEFTVEANPETVTFQLMQLLADGGVNRVSIGAQSFQRESLAALERWHDPDNVPRAVTACREADIDNLSLDLIFAIPGQTLAMLDDDLSRLVALNPTHLSTYGLTYEPNTPLAARLRVGQVTPIDEDTQRAMYSHVLERLEAEGFEHYEVSNWALRQQLGTGAWGSERMGGTAPSVRDAAPNLHPPTPNPKNRRCQHNLTYWLNRNWLGIGPSAASHRDGRRWRNVPNLATYIAEAPEVPTQDHEELGPDGRVGERLMLGLRLAEGLDLAWIDEHVGPDDRRRHEIDHLIELDMLERSATHLRLTRSGLFVADSVIAKLL
ncbi:MAG: coproporphyrinogen-III oxidase family protein [Planctomycetota bacterium]